MTTYLLITSDKPTELTASTDRKNWLPVVNAQPVTDSFFITTEAGTQAMEVRLKPDEVAPLEWWEPEVVMSDGWQPTYNNPDNSGLEQPSEPIAYRLKRSEPVKPNNSPFDLLDLSPIEAKTQEHCPKCRTTDFKSCHSMYCPIRVETPINSARPIEELFVEEYFGIRGSGDGPEINSDFGHLVGLRTSFKEKYLTPESHKTQESQEELWNDLINLYDTTDHSSYGYASLVKALSEKFILTRRNP